MQNGRRAGNNLTQDTPTACFETSLKVKKSENIWNEKTPTVHTGLQTHGQYLRAAKYNGNGESTFLIKSRDVAV